MASFIRRPVFWAGLLGIPWVLATSGIPMFWDAITLGGQTANHFMREGLDALILPANLDAGHPPLFGWYLALSGPLLPLCHMLMWPLLVMIWVQYFQFSRRFLAGRWLWLSVLLLLLEPTLLAQSVHVAPDLMLLAFYLLAVNAILDRKTGLLTLALVFLCFSGLRGCIGSAALWFFALFINQFENRRWLGVHTLLPWVVSTAAVFAWFAWHYQQTGWLLANPDSPWGDNQGFAGLDGMIWNLGIAGWRVLDFGRFVIWIPGLWLLFRTKNKKPVLLAAFLIPLLLYTLTFMPFNNPVAHRYYLPVLVLFLPWFCLQLRRLSWGPKWKYIGVAVLLLITGHLWVYPDKMAQGWDGSLAHLPYLKVRQDLEYYLCANESLEVYSEFPVNKSYADARPALQREYATIGKIEGSWKAYPYVIYSNVINDISEEDYHTVTSWEVVQSWQCLWVRLSIYKNPDLNPQR